MVKKSVRPRGRPRTFDEAEALEAATKVFWAKGFDGATVDDLVAEMGVRRPSLYAIFGDKASLFMRCLEGYGRRNGALVTKIFEDTGDIRQVMCNFLRFSVEKATAENSPWGCLMICVAPLVEDVSVREFLIRAEAQASDMVERRLRQAMDAGELPPDFPAAVRARQAIDLSRGLTVRARIGASREVLLADAEEGGILLLRSSQA